MTGKAMESYFGNLIGRRGTVWNVRSMQMPGTAHKTRTRTGLTESVELFRIMDETVFCNVVSVARRLSNRVFGSSVVAARTASRFSAGACGPHRNRCLSWSDRMNPRVLLVDDEKDFLATLVKRLGRRQVGAEAVTSGEEGLAFLDKHEVDVVVLDVRMPGMDGLSVLREIKRRYPLVEVIMLSGHADAQTAVQGMEMGAFDYLLKPTDIEEMVYKIEDAHAKKRLQEERIEQRKREVPS